MFDGIAYRKHDSVRQDMINVILTTGVSYKMFTFATTTQTRKHILGKHCFHSPPYLRKYFDMPTQSLVLITFNDQVDVRRKCSYFMRRHLTVRQLLSFNLAVNLDIEDHTELVIDTLEAYPNLKLIDTLLIHDSGIFCKVNVAKLIKLKVLVEGSSIILTNPYVNTIPLNVKVNIYKIRPSSHICELSRDDLEILISAIDGLHIRFVFPTHYTVAYHEILIRPGKYYIDLNCHDIVFRGAYNLV
jgi:hypothetical protein